MLVQTSIIALLAAAPALVHAAPERAPASGTSREETLVKVKSVITSIKEKQAKSHQNHLKIDTTSGRHSSHKSGRPSRFGTPTFSRFSAGYLNSARLYDSGSGQYGTPRSAYSYPQYSPTYGALSPYGGYPYSPQLYSAAPVVSPGYGIVRRSTIPSPQTPSSPRALLARPIVPLADLGTLERSRIGRAGGPHIAAQYNRKDGHYKQRKAGVKEHNYTSEDWVRLENILEAAERVVNGVEGQMNKAETVFPEVEAANRRMKKVFRTKMAAATKVASAKPATPAKSG